MLEEETDRQTQTDRYAESWEATGQTERGVVKSVCCSRGHSSFLVGVVWLTWWELLPGRGQPGPCLGSRPFIGFLIGGSAAKRLTSLACLFGCLSLMKCTGESGGCGPQVTQILKSFECKNTQTEKNTCSQTKHLNVVGGCYINVSLYQSKPGVCLG